MPNIVLDANDHTGLWDKSVFAAYGYGQGWNSGGIGGLISGSYFSLMECTWCCSKGGFYHQDYFIIRMCISVWPDENFGFHELAEFKNLRGMIWVMLHFLKHLKVSFAISVRDTEGVQDVRFVFMSPIQKCIHLLLCCVWAFFLTRILSCQFQSEPGLSQSQLQLTYWCISILMYTVSSLFCQQEGACHWYALEMSA